MKSKVFKTHFTEKDSEELKKLCQVIALGLDMIQDVLRKKEPCNVLGALKYLGNYAEAGASKEYPGTSLEDLAYFQRCLLVELQRGTATVEQVSPTVRVVDINAPCPSYLKW